MKTKIPQSVALAGCIALFAFSSGCSDPPPPEKSTKEKLDSPDPAEQDQGLNEARDKYGGKQ